MPKNSNCVYVVILLYSLRLVGSVHLALEYRRELALDELLANRRHMIDEHLAVEMVVLMKSHSRCKAFDALLMFDKILVKILHHDPCRTLHWLLDAWD